MFESHRKNLEKLKVVFMATSSFAAPAFKKLNESDDHEIIALYTKEPKKAGRGHKMQNSPIHNLALETNIPVFTPKTLRDKSEQEKFTNLNGDLAVVVSYGLILPPEILAGTKFGCVNIHPSSLPRWRGAAPLQRSLMAGEKLTKICLIQMDEGLDSGNILLAEELALDDKIDSIELAEKTAEIGANLLIKYLDDFDKFASKAIKQNDAKATYAHKITKEEFKIDWQKSAREIHNQIRGLNCCGSAFFEINGNKVKIHKAKLINEDNHNYKAGEIISADLKIACKTGIIQPIILQKSGKQKMMREEFLRGSKFSLNIILN